MSEHELRRAVRHAKKANRLGPVPKCKICGEHDIRVLHKVGRINMCADCHNEIQGESPFEHHHIAGRHNDSFTIPLSANDHAILSDAQYDWPRETLRNPNQDPLREIAAWLRGVYDLLDHLANKLLVWATKLERVSEILENFIGVNWSSKVEGSGNENDE